MSDYVLAILSPATRAELFAAEDPELPLRVARAAGEALEILGHQPGCRIVVVERDVEPQLGRLVQRLRQVIPAVDVVWLAPAVGPGPRQELHALRVDWLDRGLPAADLQRTLRHRFRRAKLQAEAGIIGRDPQILEILEIALQVGPTDIPVLITGPSGAGKEGVARAFFLASRRTQHPFVALNVGALAESVLESELFGHEKGAFTGAIVRKEGVFERADHGTLFLDEVGEMSPHMQVRLLRALDTGEITLVGGSRALRVDVRVLAATNRALDVAVRRGEFREDLYYRLKVVHVEVPSLAARRDDLPDLVQYFLDESARLYGTPVRRASDETLRLLAAHDWPGNIRELRNAVHGMAVLAQGTRLEPADLPEALRREPTPNSLVALHRSTEHAERDVILTSLLALRRDLQEVLMLLRGGQAPARTMIVEPAGEIVETEPPSLRETEKEMILGALAATGGNRRLAAERLGIAERTLYRKLKGFGLS